MSPIDLQLGYDPKFPLSAHEYLTLKRRQRGIRNETRWQIFAFIQTIFVFFIIINGGI